MNFQQEAGRNLCLYDRRGKFQLMEILFFKSQDAARITDIHEIMIKGNQDSFFLLMDFPGVDF